MKFTEKHAPALLGGTPQVDRKKWPTWPPRLEELEAPLLQIIRTDQWGIGSETIKIFETEFAHYHDAAYGLAMANGTLALYVALVSVGVSRGDEVILPGYTFMATASAILLAGGVPVFVDIDPDTGNINPQAAEAAITRKTRAIMPVHVGGNPADLSPLQDIAQRHNLALIEDAAQAHGAIYLGKKVGAIGTVGCFSFQSSKNITSGEGGFLVTNDRNLYEKAFQIYNCGRTLSGEWYQHAVAGQNIRISAFQAAILKAQLNYVEEWAVIREDRGCYLEELLEDIPGISCLARYSRTKRNAYHLFIFRYNADAFHGLSKTRFLEALNAEGVVATDGYTPLHQADFLPPSNISLPETEALCRDGVWIRQFELLADRSMIAGIAQAIMKIQANAQRLAH